MNLKITKEKVLEAAATCSEAEEALKALFPEVFEKEITYHRGQRFKRGEDEFILAFADYEDGSQTGALIDVNVGSMWHGRHKVADSMEITEKEMKAIKDGFEFKLI